MTIFAAIRLNQYCSKLKISPPASTIPANIGTVYVNDKTGLSNRDPIIPPTSAHVPVRQHISIMNIDIGTAVLKDMVKALIVESQTENMELKKRIEELEFIIEQLQKDREEKSPQCPAG